MLPGCARYPEDWGDYTLGGMSSARKVRDKTVNNVIQEHSMNMAKK
jgi:hypothetical protein